MIDYANLDPPRPLTRIRHLLSGQALKKDARRAGKEYRKFRRRLPRLFGSTFEKDEGPAMVKAKEGVAPYAFLFDAERQASTGPIFASFYQALLAREEGGIETFRLRSGLLLEHSVRRPVGLRTRGQPDRPNVGYSGEGVKYQADIAFWAALMADLADSAKETWCTFDPLVLPYYLATRRTFVVAVSSLSQAMAEHIDREIKQSVIGFMGVLQMDPGNPLQIKLLWDEQIEVHVYDSGHLGLCIDIQDDDEFPLEEADEWWSPLSFRSIFRLRRAFGYSAFVGEEFVLSAPIDRSREIPPDLQSQEVSARGAASKMLYETGTQLTVVEKVVSAVAGRMAQGEDMPSAVEVSLSRVPGASKAFAQPRRLQEYLLNPDHPIGQHKAQLFKDVLGLATADWRYLSDQLTQGLPSGEVARVRLNPDGSMQFDVHLPVVGKNGRTAPVLSAWVIRGSIGPELVTAYPTSTRFFIGDPDSFPNPRVILGFNSSNYDECSRLFKIADAAGLDAASQAIPTPMFIDDEVIAEGKFGRAYVVVKDARRGLARWLINEGKAETMYGSPGAWMWAPAGYPHVDRAKAYAQAFVEVLEINGVTARVKALLN